MNQNKFTQIQKTDDAKYTNLLLKKQMVWWKRLVNVQAPYRWNLQQLRPGYTLEIGLGIGFASLLFGIMLILKPIILSYSPGFDTIDFVNSVRLIYGARLSIMMGGQIILSSFVWSILGINPKK